MATGVAGLNEGRGAARVMGRLCDGMSYRLDRPRTK